MTEQTLVEETSKQNRDRASSIQPPKQQSSWMAPTALLIAVAAAGLGIWGVLRPAASPGEPSPAAADTSTEQVAGSKAELCGAFDTVRSAVSMQTHAVGDGPAGVQAVAANARLSMLGGAAYLAARTGPSTPADLADAIHKFSYGLQDIAMHSLTGVGNDDPLQAERLREADAASKSVAEICAQP